jgi:formylglycine-generating enzyme required for sulfatase activity
MSGNVYEWCSDWWGNYSSGSQTNPQGSSSGFYRMFRGGSWYCNAGRCRVAYRLFNPPDYRVYILGLRLAL